MSSITIIDSKVPTFYCNGSSIYKMKTSKLMEYGEAIPAHTEFSSNADNTLTWYEVELLQGTKLA